MRRDDIKIEGWEINRIVHNFKNRIFTTNHLSKMEKQLTKEEAISFAESGIWKSWTDEQIVRLQLFQNKLCMPFSRFHEALNKVLDRPVYTHELACPDELKKEYLGAKCEPTFEEIINLIPSDKRVIIQQ